LGEISKIRAANWETTAVAGTEDQRVVVRQGKLFTNQGQGLLDDLIREVHSRCNQSLNDRAGGGKKALALRAEDQSQGSNEGYLKNLSATTSRQVIHNGD